MHLAMGGTEAVKILNKYMFYYYTVVVHVMMKHQV